MLRHLIDMYHGTLHTIREHLLFDTRIAQFLYETAGIPNVSFKTRGVYMYPTSEYEGFVGNDADKESLPILIGGVAEMLAKIMLIRKLGLNEQEVYECPAIRDAVIDLTTFINKLKMTDLNLLLKQIGHENLRFLNDRLDDGYVKSFDLHGDSMMTRALMLFQLVNFSKYHEIKWFGCYGCLSNNKVRRDVERLAQRIFHALLPMTNNRRIDFFPKYGCLGKLTVLADIQIGDMVLLISTLGKEQWSNDSFYRSAVILNACADLAKHDNGITINKKLIFHVRWNSFTTVL